MNLAKEVTAIEWGTGLRSSPAVTDLWTGVVYLNPSVWPHLRPEYQQFILLHEEGHVKRQTLDELQADAYAFEQYVKAGLDPEHLVNAITGIIPDSPQTRSRAAAMQKRVAALSKPLKPLWQKILLRF